MREFFKLLSSADDDHYEGEQQVVELGRLVDHPPEYHRRMDAGDPARTVGERLPVVERHPHDLAEGERDDGEVVAAQSERWRTDDEPEEHREQHRHGHDDPEVPLQIEARRREYRGRVRPHGEERDVAEVQQPGLAEHEVEAHREQYVDERAGAEAKPQRLHQSEVLEQGEDDRERERGHDEGPPRHPAKRLPET
jgi:hypothetical protein